MSNHNPSKQLSPLVIAIIAIASIAAGIVINQFLSRSTQGITPTGLEATVLPAPRQLKPFNLVDHDNQPFKLDRFKGNWSFVFFGFTNCPDVCPTALKIMQLVWNKLPEDRSKPNMFFISVDPDRDNTPLLKKYVTYYHPDFVGVTGQLDQLDNLTNQLGVLYGYDENKQDSPEDYTVNHSAQILLIDPQARLRAVFSTPYDANSISHAFDKIRNFYQE